MANKPKAYPNYDDARNRIKNIMRYIEHLEGNDIRAMPDNEQVQLDEDIDNAWLNLEAVLEVLLFTRGLDKELSN